MVSMRFPFPFSQPPPTSNRRLFSSVAVGCTVAAAAAGVAVVATHHHTKIRESALNFILANVSHTTSSHFWASVSLSQNPSSSSDVIESRTGVAFPSVINDSQRLLGVGLRKKSILGLKNIDVYAYGVYADETGLKKHLNEKYGKLSASTLNGSEALREDLMEADVSTTVRLQIVYGKLGIRSVRSAFEDSVGSRLQKFGGPDIKELLQRFTAQFKDEYKIPRGSVIEMSREQGHILRTKIDGMEVGSIQSKLLCKSVLDLYIGDDPFDHKAKEDVTNHLATFLDK